MRSITLTATILFALSACYSPKSANPHIEIQTQYGDIELELYPQQAPKSVTAFLSYVDSGYYKNTSFYRALNDQNQPMGAAETQLIQGGLWGTDEKKGRQIPTIPHETTKQTGIMHNDGTISLARQAPGTASTEFFICIGSQPRFDYGGVTHADSVGYAAFGKVVKGMDIVKKIHRQPIKSELFYPHIFIRDIVRL